MCSFMAKKYPEKQKVLVSHSLTPVPFRARYIGIVITVKHAVT